MVQSAQVNKFVECNFETEFSMNYMYNDHSKLVAIEKYKQTV